jgi:hypothetical protein
MMSAKPVLRLESRPSVDFGKIKGRWQNGGLAGSRAFIILSKEVYCGVQEPSLTVLG